MNNELSEYLIICPSTIHDILPVVNTEFLPQPNVDYEIVYSIFMFLFKDVLQYLQTFNIDRHCDYVQSLIAQSSFNTSIIYSSLTLGNIYCFVGALFITDIYQLPELGMYWGHQKPLMSNTCNEKLNWCRE